MHMTGEGLDATFADLVIGFLTNARRYEKFRKCPYKIFSGEVPLFAKLVACSNEIIDVDQRPDAYFIHRLVQSQGIASIDEPAPHTLKPSGISQKIQHDRTAAASIVNLYIDQPVWL